MLLIFNSNKVKILNNNTRYEFWNVWLFDRRYINYVSYEKHLTYTQRDEIKFYARKLPTNKNPRNGR